MPELAGYLGCSQEEVLDGLQTAEAHDTVSLDAPSGGGGGDDDADPQLYRIGDKDRRLARIDASATVFAAAQALPQRERTILYLRFLRGSHSGRDRRKDRDLADAGSRLLRRSVRRLQQLTSEEPG